MIFVHTVKCIFVIQSVHESDVDIKLHKYEESNVIGYNRNCFSTTVALGFTVHIWCCWYCKTATEVSQYVMNQCARTEYAPVTCYFL